MGGGRRVKAGVSVLISPACLSFRVPKGWVRVVIVTLDLCACVCVCVFRGMICCCPCQKLAHPLGASSQQSPVSFWKFCECSGACVCALFEVDCWFLPVFER